MKRTIILLLTILPLIGFAQDSDSLTLSSPKKIKSEVKDMLMLDFTHDRWLNAPDSINVAWFSRGFKMELIYDIPISTGPFSFGIGGAISSHNVFSNALAVTSADTAYLSPLPNTYSYKKNKLVTTYGDLVAELRLRTSLDKHNRAWKFALGVRVGTLMQVHSKIVDDIGKYKNYNFFNVTKTRYMANARIGYGRWGVSAFYSLTPLFENVKDSNIIPVSLAITLSLF